MAILSDVTEERAGPLAVAAAAQAYTAAAAEARMCGLNVPIMAIAGSGNHGITNFVGCCRRLRRWALRSGRS